MARYSRSLLDLLQEEDHLMTELEKVQDNIVSELYVTEESKDEKKVKKAKETVNTLRLEEGLLKEKLSDARRSIRHRLLNLFE